MCLNFHSAAKPAPGSAASSAPREETSNAREEVELVTIEIQGTQFVITSLSANEGLYKYSCGMASKTGADGNLTLERDPRLDASAHFYSESAVVVTSLGEAPSIIQLYGDRAIVVSAPQNSLPVGKACRIDEDTGLFYNCRNLKREEKPAKPISFLDLRAALSNITKYCDGFFSQNVQGKVDPKTVDGPYSPNRMVRIAESHSNFRAVTGLE